MKNTKNKQIPANISDELSRIYQLEMEMLNDTPVNYYSDDGGIKNFEC